ncbi:MULTISPECIES: hypothetical protein [unclassified Acinetobacter]|uniref:hypothetical protein n=1 Tax=unclassified Acinetobacter TaxID=196816 RepID=UPI0035B761D0
MSVKLNRLFEETVEFDIQSLTYFSTRPEDIEVWRLALRDFELGEAAKQVFISLLELRHIDWSEQTRFDVVQTIEPVITHLFASLEQHYLDHALIDAKRDQQISDLVLEIKTHLALLYKEIFERTHEQIQTTKFSLFNFNGKKRLIQLRNNAAINALEHFNNLLYSLQLIYVDPPRLFWATCYSIYQTAFKDDFEQEQVERKSNQHQTIYSVERAFINLVVFSILNGNKLRQTEVKELKRLIPDWTSYVKLHTKPTPDTNYAILYESKIAPRVYIADEYRNEPASFIDFQDLIAYIEKNVRLSEQSNLGDSKSLSSVLRHHVITTLQLKLTRIQPRLNDEGFVQVALGIHPAHFFISGAKEFKESLKLDIGFGLQSISQEYKSTAAAESSLEYAQQQKVKSLQRLEEQQLSNEIFRIRTASIINRSEKGYGLRWQAEAVKNLRTGDFILIKENQKNHWNGGLIRWLKNAPDRSVELGIEVLSHKICAVAVYIPKVNVSQPVYHPALIYRPIESPNDYAIILPSAQLFHENQNLSLRFDTIETKIFLQKSTNLTQSCASFNFGLLEQSRKAELDEFFTQQIISATTQDLWESLK